MTVVFGASVVVVVVVVSVVVQLTCCVWRCVEMWVVVYGVSGQALYMYEGRAKRRGTGGTMKSMETNPRIGVCATIVHSNYTRLTSH